MEKVLIATLGESPVIVTAMYDLLKKETDVAINRIIVLYPQQEGLISTAFDLIQEALQDKCAVIPAPLPFEDIASEPDSFTFLHTLYRLLNAEQKNANSVYLSLAGGRKNMSALMAILVPLFPSVKGLYHVIDSDEGTRRDHLKSIEYIFDLSYDERLSCFLLTDDQLARLKLVEIPYGEQQRVSEEYRSLLFSITEEDLDELWNKDPARAEMVETYRLITRESTFTPVLKIELTASVEESYKLLLHDNAPQASRFARCFEQMKDPYHLFEAIKDSGFKHESHSFHFYKRRRTVERPFYYTEPQNIELLNIRQISKGAKVDSVIIAGLAVEQNDGTYKPTAEKLLRDFDPKESTVSLESILPIGTPTQLQSENESVLIVPLGDRPMIATQLYTLLTYQGSNISEVVLVYPAKVKAGAELLAKAFEDEGKRIGREISCIPKPVPGYDDIDSKKACQAFEQTLEAAIDEACKRHRGCLIELALSGGRKGMAALAMFVAQRKDIHYLYHTLISDPDPDKRFLAKIEDETTVDNLRPTKVSKELRNDRLFLRAYEGNGPYTKFVLFKVPVLPARG